MSGPAICAKCRHHARGEAVAVPIRTGREAGKPRSGLQGGNYICAREGLTPATPDPVTGFAGQPSGPDCRDLNPDGECEHYRRGVTHGEALAVAVAMVLAPVVLAVAIAIAGAL